jgi:succinoglycan biosynthesis transport protein ExoP
LWPCDSLDRVRYLGKPRFFQTIGWATTYGMNRAEFLRVLARQKLVAFLTAAVVVAGGVLFLTLQPPVYESSASVAVLPGSRLNSVLGAYDVVVSRLLPQYASIVRSQTFLDRVGAAVPGAGDSRRLRSRVFARPDAAAAVLELVAHDENPQQAARLARATLQQFLSETQGTDIVDFQVIDQPRVPHSPVAPRRKLVLGSLPLVAVLLACAVAIAWNRLFGRIRELDELRMASGRRVLGALPYVRRLRRSGSSLFIGNPSMTDVDKGLRSIRTVLLLLRPSREAPTVITVTSLGQGDGKSTLSANLAVAAAEVGLQVLVMDVDTRGPRQREIFELPDRDGLTPVMHVGEDIGRAVQPTAFVGVNVLTLGRPMQHRSETVKLYLHAVSGVGQLADLVIVDSPPLSSDADVGLLAGMTDGVVLLVRAGTMTAGQLRNALEGLDAVGVPLLGLVLTMSSKHAVTSNAPYGYGEGPDAEPQPARRAWWGRSQPPSVGENAAPREHKAGPQHDPTAEDARWSGGAREPDETAPLGDFEPSAAESKATPRPPGDRSRGPSDSGVA